MEMDCTTMRILVALDLEEREASYAASMSGDVVPCQGDADWDSDSYDA
jgi:hypothetical protein